MIYLRIYTYMDAESETGFQGDEIFTVGGNISVELFVIVVPLQGVQSIAAQVKGAGDVNTRACVRVYRHHHLLQHVYTLGSACTQKCRVSITEYENIKYRKWKKTRVLITKHKEMKVSKRKNGETRVLTTKNEKKETINLRKRKYQLTKMRVSCNENESINRRERKYQQK